MATSFLPSSPSMSLIDYGVSQACLNLNSRQWQRGVTGLSSCLRSHQCNFKLHMIPTHQFLLKTSTSVHSLQAHTNQQKHHASSVVSAPNDFQSTTSSFGGMEDFEIQLQELFNQVKTMIKIGNKEDAIDILQANYEAVKEQMDAGVKGIEQAAILDIIALGYMAVGDLNFVKSLLDTMNEFLGHLKDDEPLLDSILIHVASMHSTLGKFEKSMFIYQRVLNVLESKYGNTCNFLITPLLGMAKVLSSMGRTTKAVEIYHRAINILEMSKGAESEDLVVPLFGLGNLLIKEGRATEAESHFIRILNIYAELYGGKDGRVGMALCYLAHVKCAEGDADGAIDLYKNAFQVIKDSNYMSLGDSIMESMRIELAELLHLVGRGKEGREVLEECLLITEQCNGKEHPKSVTHLLNLAASHSHSKNFVEAERLLRTGLDIMRKTLGPEDQSITFPLLHLAVTLYHLNREGEAEQLALQALCIREKAFGKDSLPVGEALDCLVSIQARLGKDDGHLLELLERILRIQEKEFGFESQEILVTLQKIVFYLDRLGRRIEKTTLQKRLSMLRRKYQQTVPH